MNVNEYNITDSKKYENKNNNKSKKRNFLDTKQNLFMQQTTQSSQKVKYKDNEESSYLNSKYKNHFNIKNNEYNTIEDNNKKRKANKNEKLSLRNNSVNIQSEKKNMRKIFMRNDNEIKSFLTKSQIQNKNYFLNSNTSFKKIDLDNFNNNDDLIYILTTNKNGNEKETEDESDSYNYERNTSHIALPFCHYHKFNVNLPKIYTCNFKKCFCCAVPEKDNFSFFENLSNNNYKNNEYDKLKSRDKKKLKYRSVLDKFKKKNINVNKKPYWNKTKFDDSFESDDLEGFDCNFQKPNNLNLKINKIDYISENESENSNDDSSGIELPSDLIIDDEKELRKYKNMVNANKKQSKLHFSIIYYKKLNKSYNQIYSKDIKK